MRLSIARLKLAEAGIAVSIMYPSSRGNMPASRATTFTRSSTLKDESDDKAAEHRTGSASAFSCG
jgi:hypothetical protein